MDFFAILQTEGDNFTRSKIRERSLRCPVRSECSCRTFVLMECISAGNSREGFMLALSFFRCVLIEKAAAAGLERVCFGRGERIRTSDPLLPRQVR